MPRQIEKKAFLFYATTLDLLEELKPERQGKVAMALIEYGLDEYNYFAEFSGSLSILEPLERIVFRSVIYEIAVQKRRYHNKYLLHGAVETIQSVIAKDVFLDDKTRERYLEIIRVLEERYQYALKHDVRNVPEELFRLLPKDIFELFHKRYEVKTVKEDFSEMLENRLEAEEKKLSDDVKETILEQIVLDYFRGSPPFARYEELLEEYAEDS